jgi:hypothetical protein
MRRGLGQIAATGRWDELRANIAADASRDAAETGAAATSRAAVLREGYDPDAVDLPEQIQRGANAREIKQALENMKLGEEAGYVPQFNLAGGIRGLTPEAPLMPVTQLGIRQQAATPVASTKDERSVADKTTSYIVGIDSSTGAPTMKKVDRTVTTKTQAGTKGLPIQAGEDVFQDEVQLEDDSVINISPVLDDVTTKQLAEMIHRDALAQGMEVTKIDNFGETAELWVARITTPQGVMFVFRKKF